MFAAPAGGALGYASGAQGGVMLVRCWTGSFLLLGVAVHDHTQQAAMWEASEAVIPCSRRALEL